MWTIDFDEYKEPERKTNAEAQESDSDRYWREMAERKQQRRDWEDRGEPVGW